MNDPYILVVDDNQSLREVVSRRLREEGYEVLNAEDGVSALELMATETLQLVLLDLEMPGMSGLEVLDKIRIEFPSEELPVIIISANDDSQDMAEAIDRGADDFMTKPIRFEFLLAKVRQHLRHRAARRDRLTSAPDCSPGQVLGHYQLLESLGRGQMGEVFRAEDTQLLRQVAIKVMFMDSRMHYASEQFLAEARAVAQVDHPGVIRIHDVALFPQPHIVMELVQGVTLEEYAAQHDFSLNEIRDLLLQVLSAVQAVHDRGIIHRDLKPTNLLVTPQGRVKLTDFGLAGPINEEGDRASRIYGTPEYMAPEHFWPKRGKVDAQTDVFAVGVILYQMLTGYLPFLGDTAQARLQALADKPPRPISSYAVDIPPEWNALCMKALEKDKGRRYQSANEMAQDVRRAPGRTPAR